MSPMSTTWVYKYGLQRIHLGGDRIDPLNFVNIINKVL